MESHSRKLAVFFLSIVVIGIISFSAVLANNSPRAIMIDSVSAKCDGAIVNYSIDQNDYWIDVEIYNDVTDPTTPIASDRHFFVAIGSDSFTLTYPMQTNTSSLRVWVGLEVDESQPYEAEDTEIVPVDCGGSTPTFTSVAPTATETANAPTSTSTAVPSTQTSTPNPSTSTNTPEPFTPTFAPATATNTLVPAATNTAVPSDGRFCFGPGAAPVALYARNGGLDIYQINGADQGLLILRYTADDLKALPAKPDKNIVIGKSEDGKVIFYKLTSGEYQINVGPVEWLNKVHVCRFSAIPDRNAILTSFYLSH